MRRKISHTILIEVFNIIEVLESKNREKWLGETYKKKNSELKGDVSVQMCKTY